MNSKSLVALLLFAFVTEVCSSFQVLRSVNFFLNLLLFTDFRCSNASSCSWTIAMLLSLENICLDHRKAVPIPNLHPYDSRCYVPNDLSNYRNDNDELNYFFNDDPNYFFNDRPRDHFRIDFRIDYRIDYTTDFRIGYRNDYRIDFRNDYSIDYITGTKSSGGGK